MATKRCTSKHCVACGKCASAEVQIRGEWEAVCPEHLQQTIRRFAHLPPTRRFSNVQMCSCTTADERRRARYRPRGIVRQQIPVPAGMLQLLAEAVQEATGQNGFTTDHRHSSPIVYARTLFIGSCWVYASATTTGLARMLALHHTSVTHHRNNFLLRFIAEAKMRSDFRAVRDLVNQRIPAPLLPRESFYEAPALRAACLRAAFGAHEENVDAVREAVPVFFSPRIAGKHRDFFKRAGIVLPERAKPARSAAAAAERVA